jgi:hypothetical protein
MLKKLVLAATVAATLTAGAPVAHAAPVRAECGFGAVAQETVTGGQDTYTGTAYGYAVFDDLNVHTLRCYVTVDGAEQASTPTGSGQVLVHTEGLLTYNAPEGSDVDVCTEIDSQTVGCRDADQTQFLPQEVQDAVDALCAKLPPPLSDCPPYLVIAYIEAILPP